MFYTRYFNAKRIKLLRNGFVQLMILPKEVFKLFLSLVGGSEHNF